MQTLAAHFHDGQGKEAQLEGPMGEFGIDPSQLSVPSQGAAIVQTSFDLSDTDLSAPVHGDVVIVGSFTNGIVNFVGSLECQ